MTLENTTWHRKASVQLFGGLVVVAVIVAPIAISIASGGGSSAASSEKQMSTIGGGRFIPTWFPSGKNTMPVNFPLDRCDETKDYKLDLCEGDRLNEDTFWSGGSELLSCKALEAMLEYKDGKTLADLESYCRDEPFLFGHYPKEKLDMSVLLFREPRTNTINTYTMCNQTHCAVSTSPSDVTMMKYVGEDVTYRYSRQLCDETLEEELWCEDKSDERIGTERQDCGTVEILQELEEGKSTDYVRTYYCPSD